MTVVGFDTNQAVMDRLNAGASHIGDVSGAALAAGLSGSYRASTDASLIRGADVVVVCFPTPLSDDGDPTCGPSRTPPR